MFIDLISIAVIVFLIGIYGIVTINRSVLRILISLEVMLLGINLLFILFSIYLDDLIGQIFSLMILTVAAGESALGLAILVVHYRLAGTTALDYVSNLKG